MHVYVALRSQLLVSACINTAKDYCDYSSIFIVMPTIVFFQVREYSLGTSLPVVKSATIMRIAENELDPIVSLLE